MNLYLIVSLPIIIAGFWSIVFLTTNPSKNRARHSLGFLMLIATVLYVCHALFFIGDFDHYMVADAFYLGASLSVYPMFYCYVKFLTNETRYRIFNLLHFAAPIVLFLVMMGLHIQASKNDLDVYLHETLIKNNWEAANYSNVAGIMSIVFILSRIIFALQVVYYAPKSLRLIKDYNARLTNFYTDIENRQLVWVKRVIVWLVATSAITFIANIFGRAPFSESHLLLLLASFTFSTIIFMVGYLGNKQQGIVLAMSDDSTQLSALEPLDLESTNHHERIQLKEKLLHLIREEHIYLMPDLKITVISEKLDVEAGFICKLIREEFGESFSSFVNRHRISHAKQLLKHANPQVPLIIDKIAQESGFVNTATFVKVFKNMEGDNPSNLLPHIHCVRNS